MPKRFARTFTGQEVDKILRAFDKDTFIGFRNYVIVCVLLSTGMRKSELLDMSMLNVHFDVGVISVIGKGNKQRNIPLSPLLKRLLKQYFARRTEYCSEVDYSTSALWLSRGGTALTISGVNGLFRDLKKNLDIPTKRLSAHTFRHTFAKSFLLNGGDVFTLQRLLGHADIATTQIYIDYTEKELKVQNNQYNPLDNTRWYYY